MRVGWKILSGGTALLTQQLLVYVATAAAFVVLSRTMSPAIYAVGAIVALVHKFIGAFGDLGVGAALIQSKSGITAETRNALFAVQLLMAITLCAVCIAISPALADYFRLPYSQRWLFAVVGLGYLPLGFKWTVQVIWDKSLSFWKIAILDTFSSLANISLLIILSIMGMGAWTFAVATAGSQVLSAVLAFSMSPWFPSSRGIREHSLRLLKFGLPYQGSMWVGLLKNSFAPIVIPRILGLSLLGEYRWALGMASYPNQALSAFGRLLFPAFSMVQDDGAYLAGIAERILYVLCAVSFLGMTLVIGLVHPMVSVVFGSKWDSAVVLVYVLSANVILAPINLVASSILNAKNRPGLNLRVNLYATVLQWVAGIILIKLFGIIGAAVGSVIPGLSGIIQCMYLVKMVPMKLVRNILPSLLAGGLTSSGLVFADSFLAVHSLLLILLLSIAGCILYVALLSSLSWHRLVSTLLTIRSLVAERHA